MKYLKSFNEVIKVNIKVGDTILGGRFKNKKILVKEIGKNAKGDITINGKPLLKFRIIKEADSWAGSEYAYYNPMLPRTKQLDFNMPLKKASPYKCNDCDMEYYSLDDDIVCLNCGSIKYTPLKISEGFFNRKKTKSDFIKSIIDKNVKKSKALGLDIDRYDIKLEKDVFCVIFETLWNNLVDVNLTDRKYSEYRGVVNDQVKEVFRYDYYRGKTKDKSVKNMYNCHIDDIISELFLSISNKLFDSYEIS